MLHGKQDSGDETSRVSSRKKPPGEYALELAKVVRTLVIDSITEGFCANPAALESLRLMGIKGNVEVAVGRLLMAAVDNLSQRYRQHKIQIVDLWRGARCSQFERARRVEPRNTLGYNIGFFHHRKRQRVINVAAIEEQGTRCSHWPELQVFQSAQIQVGNVFRSGRANSQPGALLVNTAFERQIRALGDQLHGAAKVHCTRR
jgi:hypothetical protein